MAEVQDEDQWLYGDDKGESPKITTEDPAKENVQAEENNDPSKDAEDKDKESSITNNPEEEVPEPTEENDEEEKENKDDNDSSSDDEPTVTIGKIVKQPDIIRPPPVPTHRTVPTSGLKDDDFTSVGKINGVAAYDYNLMELEEKPWRKPGADLSDYFNYGFNEETWFKYCERQKALRTNESGVGLVGLGINMAKSASLAFGSSSIPVSIVNENSKYGMGSIKKYNFPPPHIGHIDSNSTNGTANNSSQVNTIQVMTADRRTYSNKVLMQSGYDDMDFGGYGNQDPNYFNTPPPQNVPPFFSHPPPIHSSPWSPAVPPPGYGAPPPPMPVPPPIPFFIKEEPIDPLDLPTGKRRSKDADPERDRERRRDRDRDRDRERDREARYRESSSRRRSRSRSKSRHRKRSRSKSRVVRSKSKSKSRSRSRSHTPSHKHKKKKSKRERSERERSKSR